MAEDKGIIIGVDETDHFTFFCPICNEIMIIESIKRFRKQKTINLFAYCSKCGFTAQRKIYTDGNKKIAKYCNYKTINKPKR